MGLKREVQARKRLLDGRGSCSFLLDHVDVLTPHGRGIRRFLFRRFAGYRLDRSIVVVTYLAINIVLIFSPSLIQYHFKPLISSFAKRFGCTYAVLIQVIWPPLGLY